MYWVPCFLLSFGKVPILSPAIYWACSKCSDTGMHHMHIGMPYVLLGGHRLPKFWSPISQKNYPKISKFFTYYPPFLSHFSEISHAAHIKKLKIFRPQNLQNLHQQNSNFVKKLGKFL